MTALKTEFKEIRKQKVQIEEKIKKKDYRRIVSRIISKNNLKKNVKFPTTSNLDHQLPQTFANRQTKSQSNTFWEYFRRITE